MNLPITRYDHGYIGRWADVFIALGLRRRLGITLEQFLGRPGHYVRQAAGHPLPPAHDHQEHVNDDGTTTDPRRHRDALPRIRGWRALTSNH